MEKEELLQKARKENQHGDERITYLDERSSSWSFRVIMSVLIVYDVVVWLIGRHIQIAIIIFIALPK